MIRHLSISLRTLIVSAVLAGLPGDAQGLKDPEYQVKANYIKALMGFVTWPANAPAQDRSRPYILGVIGKSPFEQFLKETTEGKLIKDKPVQISYFKTSEGIEGCDVLFICASETERLEKILDSIKNKPILTITDRPDFVRRGVMVNFLLEGGRVQIEVNLPPMKKTGLILSSHVLKLARIVE